MTTIDWPRVAQESIFAAGLAVRWDDPRPLHRSTLVQVGLRPGTRVSARVDPGGVFVHADPPLDADGWGPLPRFGIDTASYRFDRAHFEVRAPGLCGRVIGGAIEAWLDASIRPALPEALRQPGYEPQTDPNLEETVRGLGDVLPLGPVDEAGDGHSNAPSPLARARDLTAHLTLHTRREISLPVPDMDDLEVVLPKDARLHVDITTEGTADAPRFVDLDVRADRRGVIVRSTAPGLVASLEQIEVMGMTVRPGPSISFDYTLLLEQIANATVETMKLAERLAGHYTPGLDADARLDALRPNIDRMLADAVGDLLRDLLSEYDRVVPGLSLRALLRG